MQLRKQEVTSNFDALAQQLGEKQKTVTVFDGETPILQIVPTVNKTEESVEISQYPYQTMGETLRKL